MKEHIPKITKIMKELTDIRDLFSSKSLQEEMNDIIYRLSDVRDIMDY